MDYRTYLKCLKEMSDQGKFCGDAAEELKSEIKKDFDPLEVEELKRYFLKWENGDRSERAAAVQDIKDIVFSKEAMKVGLAAFCSHRFSGGDIESF